MAISTRGMRRIVVDGEAFTWRFRADDEGWRRGWVQIVRASTNLHGQSPETISFVVPHGEDFIVTPRVIRRAIELARGHGILAIPDDEVKNLFH